MYKKPIVEKAEMLNGSIVMAGSSPEISNGGDTQSEFGGGTPLGD